MAYNRVNFEMWKRIRRNTDYRNSWTDRTFHSFRQLPTHSSSNAENTSQSCRSVSAHHNETMNRKIIPTECNTDCKSAIYHLPYDKVNAYCPAVKATMSVIWQSLSHTSHTRNGSQLNELRVSLCIQVRNDWMYIFLIRPFCSDWRGEKEARFCGLQYKISNAVLYGRPV